MNAARRLQQLALTLLWVQLLLHGQLQPLVLVALPLLLVLGLRQRRLPRPALLGLTALVLLLWASGASLGNRSALLQSACNLLWLLCGLKLLEARRHNDQRRCSLLLLLAVGLAGVGGQALAASLLQAACALLALASLLALEAGPQPWASCCGAAPFWWAWPCRCWLPPLCCYPGLSRCGACNWGSGAQRSLPAPGPWRTGTPGAGQRSGRPGQLCRPAAAASAALLAGVSAPTL